MPQLDPDSTFSPSPDSQFEEEIDELEEDDPHRERYLAIHGDVEIIEITAVVWYQVRAPDLACHRFLLI